MSAGPGRPIRVLHLLTRFNVGGPARIVLALRQEMAGLGVESILAGGVVQEGEADLAEMLGLPVLRLPELGRRVSPADDITAIRRVGGLIRKVRPHVVHTHMAKAGTIGRFAALANRVPIRVHTFHGHTLHSYFGSTGSRGVVAVERILAPTSTALIAVSRRVRDDLLARGIGRPDRFHVMDVGLDLQPYLEMDHNDQSLRESLGIPPGHRVVGMAGRLVPVKGVDVFVRAMAPLLVSRPDLHVVVAGEGPDMALIRDAQLAAGGDRIHTVGWVADMAALYGAADVMVLSSRNEGTPLTAIEACAAGVPVVATRVGGVPEVVEDGITGLLVPSDAPDALGAAVARVLDDTALADRLRQSGRSMADRFGAHRHARALLDLYERLLTDRAVAGVTGRAGWQGPR